MEDYQELNDLIKHAEYKSELLFKIKSLYAGGHSSEIINQAADFILKKSLDVG